MALSEKAEGRKEVIKNWITTQLNSNCFGLYTGSAGRGEITLDRVWMFGGLALSLEYGDPKAHVLENDDYWKVIDRELSILAPVFYDHVDDSMWRAISSPRHAQSMHSHFYRSKVYLGSTHTFLRPELVSGFPTFPAADLAVGTLQAIYPQDAVLHWLGKIGGVSTRQLDGHLGLSGDKTWKSFKVTIGDAVHNILPVSTGFTITQFGGSGTILVEVVPTSPFARVEYSNNTEFVNGGGNVDIPFKIIAEDDTEQIYPWQIVDV